MVTLFSFVFFFNHFCNLSRGFRYMSLRKGWGQLIILTCTLGLNYERRRSTWSSWSHIKGAAGSHHSTHAWPRSTAIWAQHIVVWFNFWQWKWVLLNLFIYIYHTTFKFLKFVLEALTINEFILKLILMVCNTKKQLLLCQNSNRCLKVIFTTVPCNCLFWCMQWTLLSLQDVLLRYLANCEQRLCPRGNIVHSKRNNYVWQSYHKNVLTNTTMINKKGLKSIALVCPSLWMKLDQEFVCGPRWKAHVILISRC